MSLGEKVKKPFKPLRMVFILLPLSLCFPVVLQLADAEGKTVLTALAVSLEFSVFGPAFFLLPRKLLVGWIVAAFVLLGVSSAILQWYYVGPGWADVALPRTGLPAFRALIWCFHASVAGVGLAGWFCYRRLKGQKIFVS